MNPYDNTLKFPKWTDLEILRINFDSDAQHGFDWPADAIRKLGIPFESLTIEDIEKATGSRWKGVHDWQHLEHAKIVILQNKEGVERELRNRYVDGTLPEEEEKEVPAASAPRGIAYKYCALTGHPGKMFRIRYEQVSPKPDSWFVYWLKRIKTYLTS